MFYRTAGSTSRIKEQTADMRAIAQWPEEKLFGVAPAVSAWSPYEHVDHSAKVVAAILGGLLQRDLPPLAPMSWLGHAVLLTGYIPRGKGKAPSRVRPALGTVAELSASLDSLEQLVAKVTSDAWVPPNGPVIPHPYFRGLTAAQSLRFLGIHTNHHLLIVRDIAKDGGRPARAVSLSS